MNDTGHLRICLVQSPDNSSWIIEKIARKLAEHLPAFGITATVEMSPRDDVDFNHWMSYAFANVKVCTKSSMFITHIDDPYKLALVKDELSNFVDLGICMSSDAVRTLSQMGVPSKSLTYVSPAHDGAVLPSRVVIGLTTRLYPDGRKREDLLVKLARDMSLSAFQFDIFGSGWESVISVLEGAGAAVRYFPGTVDYLADYGQMISAIPAFDYYLYLGMDEGSLGTLDALAAGVKTIVTPQGFHLDLRDGITEPVVTYEDLLTVFRRIAEDRNRRIASVTDLTWERYAERHADIWRAVLRGETDFSVQRPAAARSVVSSRASRLQFELRRFSPLRMRSALSHIPLLKPLRNLVRGRGK